MPIPMFNRTSEAIEHSADPYIRVRNTFITRLPGLVMVWVKAIAGVMAWYHDFDRRSVADYYSLSFVYHTYEFLSNILLFGCQPSYYREWVIPNIITTGLIGGTVVYILYAFTKFHEHTQHVHQTLWCGDIVDSSDEEEAKRATKDKGPN